MRLGVDVDRPRQAVTPAGRHAHAGPSEDGQGARGRRGPYRRPLLAVRASVGQHALCKYCPDECSLSGIRRE
jgi:hypothetical protein